MTPAPTYRNAFETNDVEIEQYNELGTSNQDKASIKQASRIASKKAENSKRSAREAYKTEKHSNNLTNPVLLKLAKQAGTEGDLDFMFKMMKTVDSKLNGTYQPKKSKILTSLRIRRSKSLDFNGDQYCNEIGDQLKELKINYDEEKLKKKKYRDESELIFEMFYNPTEQSQKAIKNMMAADKEQKAIKKAEKKKLKKQTEDMFEMFYNPTPETQKIVKEMINAEKEEKKKKKEQAKNKAAKQEAEDVFEMFYNPTTESRQKIKQKIKEQKEEKARAKAEKKAAQDGKNKRPSLFSNFKSEVSRGTRALDLATTTKRPSHPGRSATFPTIPTSNDFKPHVSYSTKRNVYRGTNAQSSSTQDYSSLITYEHDEDDLDLYGAPIVEPVSYLGRNAPMAVPVTKTSNPFE